MTRIAHITDPHLLENDLKKRVGFRKFRLQFLCFGQSLDAELKKQRFKDAIMSALQRSVDHILLTGDLTVDGVPEQYEVLAEILEELRIDPEQITVVAGNHDIYDDYGAWSWAQKGPLRKYADSYLRKGFKVVNDVIIKPISTLLEQPFLRSAGVVPEKDLQELAEIIEKNKSYKRPVISVQHHPPLSYPEPVTNWIDGIQNPTPMRALLEDNPGVFVVHGHIHRSLAKRIDSRPYPQIFSAPAVTSGASDVRYYRAVDGELHMDDECIPANRILQTPPMLSKPAHSVAGYI